MGSNPTPSGFVFFLYVFKVFRPLGGMVDAVDSKSISFKSVGSSPIAGKIYLGGVV